MKFYFTFAVKLRRIRKPKKQDMKKLILMSFLLLGGMTTMAQKPAQIKFDKTTHNFGTFSEKEPKVTCSFTYTNVGDQPLVINQAVASCGCTVPEYTKEPVKAGEKGEIKVTYNAGKSVGRFTKNITVRTNGDPELTRLYIKGEVTKSE